MVDFLTIKFKNPTYIVKAIWDTDIFYNYFEDIILSFPDCYYVKELIDDTIIDELLKEIYNEVSILDNTQIDNIINKDIVYNRSLPIDIPQKVNIKKNISVSI